MEWRWATRAGNCGAAGDGGDAVQLRLERRDAQLVDCGRVHARGVLVADFLLVRAARGRGRGGLLQYLPEVQAIQLKKLGEAAVGGLIGGQRIALEPAIAAVLVKVVAGVHGLVDQGGIEDAQLRRGGRGGLGVDHDSAEGGGQKSSENDAATNGNGCAEHAKTLAD